MVASCPCSIVISVPLALFSCVGAMSKKGLLVKGTKHIENLSKTNVIALDKTGTLTTGKMQLDRIEMLVKEEEKKAISYLVNMERLSNHPISQALAKIETTVEKVEEFKEISGHGLCGKIGKDLVVIGNQKMIEKCQIKTKDLPQANTYLIVNNIVIAAIYLTEQVSENTQEITQKLRKTRIIMLTGDNKEAAKKIADTGITMLTVLNSLRIP